MKRLVLCLIVTFSLILSSCGMFETPTITFTFINYFGSSVTVTPRPGEDWNEFIINNGDEVTIESINSNLLFDPDPPAAQVDDETLYRTYIFEP